MVVLPVTFVMAIIRQVFVSVSIMVLISGATASAMAVVVVVNYGYSDHRCLSWLVLLYGFWLPPWLSWSQGHDD